MSWQVYLAISVMMYLDYAVRGSWGPVLSAHLLGPLKMTGKQAGWIYAMYPLGCIVAPLIGGQIVDRWIATEWFLGGTHLVSGFLLLAAAHAVRFRWMLVLIGLHCLCFTPTLSLVNSLAFTHMVDPKVEYFRVRVWSSVAWVTVGWLLSAWRASGKLQFRGIDALLLGAFFSFVMAVYCPLCLPHTPPAGGADWAASWEPLCAMLGKGRVVLFFVLSLILSTQLQFYYLGTAKFLEDIGCPRSSVPAAMTVAQMATVVSMVLVLPYVFPLLGYRWTLVLGAIFWVCLYLVYVIQPPRWVVVASQAFQGLGFAFFFDGAIVYVNQIAPPEIRATAQSLHTVMTFGAGLFLGTHLAGYVLDRCRRDGKVHWRPFFALPCVPLIACALAFFLLFTE